MDWPVTPSEDEVKSEFIQIFSSNQESADAAFREISRKLNFDHLAFLLIFLPAHVNGGACQAAIEVHFPDITVFAVTSAGQITPAGYERNAFLALGFAKEHFRIASQLIKPLKPFSLTQITGEIQNLEQRFSKTAGWNRLGILFPDGMSKQEDALSAAVFNALPDIPIFGGSAAECKATGSPMIYYQGQFFSNAALFLLIETDLVFQMVNFDHFQPYGEKMVVTKALPDERIVQEINGAPAAEEYARLIGAKRSELSAQHFAQYPFLIKVGASYHVRSIAYCTNKGELGLLASIDTGLILRLGKADEIVRRLENELGQTEKSGEKPEFILAFDCFLRRLEIEERNRVDATSKVLRDYHVVGFNTVGEQHSGMHVNQTFVGIAFYKPKKLSLL